MARMNKKHKRVINSISYQGNGNQKYIGILFPLFHKSGYYQGKKQQIY